MHIKHVSNVIFYHLSNHRPRKVLKSGGSNTRRIHGNWFGAKPQRGPGTPEAESFLVFESSTAAKQNLHSSVFLKLLINANLSVNEKSRSPEFSCIAYD